MTNSTQFRNNEVIWRIAKYIHNSGIGRKQGWSSMHQGYRDEYYDLAAVLYAKILNNNFTGEDNHGD